MVAAALLLGGYLYLCLNDEIRHHVEQRLARHYLNHEIRVGGANFEKDRGITILDLSIRDPQRPGDAEPVLAIDSLHLAGAMRMDELLTGQPHVDRIVVQGATIRAIRQMDGRWNVQSLLPLPKFSDQTPTLEIKNATLVFEDHTLISAKAFSVRGINATLTPIARCDVNQPDSAVGPRLRVQGSADGMPARSLRFDGELGVGDGSFVLHVVVDALEISSEALSTAPVDMPKSLQNVDFDGIANVGIQLRRAAGANAALEWTVTMAVGNGKLVHPKLTSPITEISATLAATPQRLTVETLTGKYGISEIALACERHGWSPSAPLGLAVRVSRLPLDDRIPDLFPGVLLPIWDRFRPAGFANVEARMTHSDGRWSPHVTIQLVDCGLTDSTEFPYRLEKTNGKIEYRPATENQLDILSLDLTGFGSGRPIHIDGKFAGLSKQFVSPHVVPPSTTDNSLAATLRKPVTDGHTGQMSVFRPIGYLKVSGSDVPIHDDLLDALPSAGEEFIRSLKPQGLVDFWWKAEWTDSAHQRANVSQEIVLKDCSICYRKFCYPLQHINGRVTQHNGHWKLHGLESLGASGSARVVCHGDSIPNGTNRRLDLVFQATDVPLDDNLRGALSADAQRAWSEIRPQGRIDFTAHVVHETGQEKPAIEIVARPHERSVSIQPESFDYRLEQIDGEASFSAGHVELRNIRARHGRIAYSAAHGVWDPNGGVGWKFELNGLNADHLTAHRGDLLVALPPRLQKVLERLQPDGAFNLINSRLSFEKLPGADRLSASWDVYLDFHQLTLGGTPLENLSGAIRLRGRDDTSNSYTVGELDIHSLIWKDMQFTNVRGPIWVDRSLCLFGRRATEMTKEAPRPITADVYGGSVAADASLQHDGNTRYQIEAAIGGANLNRYANERLGRDFSQLSGNVSGRLSIGGTGRNLHALQGSGELHIVDANIYELPLLVAMLKVLRNRTPDTTAFNQCDMKFRIEGEHVHFDQLNLLGDAVSMYGRGESDFDRNIDLTFYALVGPADLPIPLWRAVAGGLSEQSLQLKVVGKYDRPEIQRHVLPAVDQMLQQFQTQWDHGVDAVVPSAASRTDLAQPRR